MGFGGGIAPPTPSESQERRGPARGRPAVWDSGAGSVIKALFRFSTGSVSPTRHGLLFGGGIGGSEGAGEGRGPFPGPRRDSASGPDSGAGPRRGYSFSTTQTASISTASRVPCLQHATRSASGPDSGAGSGLDASHGGDNAISESETCTVAALGFGPGLRRRAASAAARLAGVCASRGAPAAPLFPSSAPSGPGVPAPSGPRSPVTTYSVSRRAYSVHGLLCLNCINFYLRCKQGASDAGASRARAFAAGGPQSTR